MKHIVELSNGISVAMKVKFEVDALQVDCKWFDKKPEYLGPEDMNKYKSGITTLAQKAIQALGEDKKKFSIVNVSHI